MDIIQIIIIFFHLGSTHLSDDSNWAGTVDVATSCSYAMYLHCMFCCSNLNIIAELSLVSIDEL